MLPSNNTIRKKLSRYYDVFVQQVLIIENEMDEMDSYSMNYKSGIWKGLKKMSNSK